jgi:hypothetical protein
MVHVGKLIKSVQCHLNFSKTFNRPTEISVHLPEFGLSKIIMLPLKLFFPISILPIGLVTSLPVEEGLETRQTGAYILPLLQKKKKKKKTERRFFI